MRRSVLLIFVSIMQDANECWTQVVRMLQQRLPGIKSTESGEQAEAAAATAAKGFIDQYFGKWHVWSFHAFNKEATFKFGGIIILFL